MSQEMCLQDMKMKINENGKKIRPCCNGRICSGTHSSQQQYTPLSVYTQLILALDHTHRHTDTHIRYTQFTVQLDTAKTPLVKSKKAYTRNPSQLTKPNPVTETKN